MDQLVFGALISVMLIKTFCMYLINFPFAVSNKSNSRAWSDGTHKFFMDLWQRGLAAEVGLCLLPMVRLTSESGYETADWMGIPFGGTRLTDRQLELISRDGKKEYT